MDFKLNPRPSVLQAFFYIFLKRRIWEGGNKAAPKSAPRASAILFHTEIFVLQ